MLKQTLKLKVRIKQLKKSFKKFTRKLLGGCNECKHILFGGNKSRK